MRNLFLILLITSLSIYSCTNKQDIDKGKGPVMNINKTAVDRTIKELLTKTGESQNARIEKCVAQVAALWQETDGDEKIFTKFCLDNFIVDSNELDKLFLRLSENFEIIWGHNNKITLDLNRPVHLTNYEKIPVDEIFASYSPGSHLSDDFFKNKIAFVILLNFQHYSLDEKTKLGKNWSRKEWAYARMGDLFGSRVPGEILQKQSEAVSVADLYISDYNIYMGKLIDTQGKTYFPEDLKLISHWGLRDELKSHYSDSAGGVDKQKMIYQVMKRIIHQDIPQCVINSNLYSWDPDKNKVFKDGKPFEFKPEPDTRYQHILNNFMALKAADEYSPNYPNFISRKFDEEYELPQKTVETLFTEFVSSPLVKKVGKLISQRLNRKLEPFDIWYDGFKARSSISETDLTKTTMAKYSNPNAMKQDLPNILLKLGFSKDKANLICSKIEVDPARGSGHAWGAQMKSENAHLRTRITDKGMDYKGYNIAIHEFGHNVEQTLTLNEVDYYMLNGVPNTAFTEAWAFIYQKRDLDILGIKENNPDKKTMMILDNFWSTYEIMGVSLVDMNVWKWLYSHPDATSAELKEAVLTIAKDIWNKYYAEVFGIKDQTILAIYSHMIDNPLYLSAYPIGHLIEFQMDSFMEGKNLGTEMIRICTQGKITPQYWMMGAVGRELSIEPTLEATETALNSLK